MAVFDGSKHGESIAFCFLIYLRWCVIEEHLIEIVAAPLVSLHGIRVVYDESPLYLHTDGRIVFIVEMNAHIVQQRPLNYRGRPHGLRWGVLEPIRYFLLARREITNNGCWEWRGHSIRAGYGVVCIQKKHCVVHRIAAHAWMDFDVNSQLLICHKCDNPPCFNPDHLFIGTDKDNIIDCQRKGRLFTAKGEEHGMAKLNSFQVERIRLFREVTGMPFHKMCTLFGIERTTAIKICSRILWSHII